MNIIVVGCGRVGSHLASLLSEDGHNVSVIDRKPGSFSELGRDFNGRTIKGIGFDEDTLIDAGVEDCDVVAAVTSSDNANLMTAEVARRIFGVKHVITRLYAPKRERIYAQLGVDFACGTTLVAEEIFAKIQSGHGHHIDSFGDYELVRFALNLEAGETLSCAMLEERYDARVVVYERDENTYLPESSTELRDGDVMIACIPRENFGAFSRYVRS